MLLVLIPILYSNFNLFQFLSILILTHSNFRLVNAVTHVNFFLIGGRKICLLILWFLLCPTQAVQVAHGLSLKTPNLSFKWVRMVQGLYLLGFFLVTYVFETVVFHKSVPDKVKKQHECTLAFIFLKKIRKKIQLTKNRN